MGEWVGTLVLTAAVAAVVIAVPAAHAQEQERCYGVAEAGEDAGVGGADTPGSSTLDYQGDAWVMVARGTCLTMALPPQPDGTPRRGALEPLDRDRP
jgi:uncharacterized membrane protein